MAADWQHQRVSRWHAFCQQELAGGGRRVYQWIRAGADAPAAPEAGGHLLGTMQALAALRDAWQGIWEEPWGGRLGGCGSSPRDASPLPAGSPTGAGGDPAVCGWGGVVQSGGCGRVALRAYRHLAGSAA